MNSAYSPKVIKNSFSSDKALTLIAKETPLPYTVESTPIWISSSAEKNLKEDIAIKILPSFTTVVCNGIYVFLVLLINFNVKSLRTITPDAVNILPFKKAFFLTWITIFSREGEYSLVEFKTS